MKKFVKKLGALALAAGLVFDALQQLAHGVRVVGSNRFVQQFAAGCGV